MNKIASVISLIVAFVAQVAWAAGQSTSLNNTSPALDKVLLIKGKVAGEWKAWLVVEAYNGHEWISNGYDPKFTHVVADYKPLFRKLPDGRWEIIFPPIAEKIP